MRLVLRLSAAAAVGGFAAVTFDSRGAADFAAAWQASPSLAASASVLLHKKPLHPLTAVAAETVVFDRPATPLPAKKKPMIVVLGSGWGAVSFLSKIDAKLYDVRVISPRNYFLFTPLLPSATVGTVDTRSISTSMHTIVNRLNRRAGFKPGKAAAVISRGGSSDHAELDVCYSPPAAFYEAAATEVDFVRRVVHCRDTSEVRATVQEDNCTFEIPYDHLVIAVGADTNTFGTPGVTENAFFLKRNEDALRLRNHVQDCFETANLPATSLADVQRLLNFVIVGGGPTGIEFAAELNDFLFEDLSKNFPHLARHVRITVIQSGDHILNTYDAKVSNWAEQQFARDGIEVVTNARVTHVGENNVTVLSKSAGAQAQQINCETCVWATGIAPAPVVASLRRNLDNAQQTHRSLLVTDGALRVKGVHVQNNVRQDGLGPTRELLPRVFAIGDCATVHQSDLLDEFMRLFKEADMDGNGFLDMEEFKAFVARIAPEHPQILMYGRNVEKTFRKADVDRSGELSVDEFRELLQRADRRLKSSPATAQAATQQGEYVARLLNAEAAASEPVIFPSFEYHHGGSLAYLGGNNAVLDFGRFSFQGLATWWAWRSIYWSKQQTLENAISVQWDWFKTLVFGRDQSRF